VTRITRPGSRRSKRLSGALGVAVLVLVACDGGEPPGAQAPAAPRGAALEARGSARWVGAERCGSCHEPQLKRWRGSHHDLAMQHASEASVLGDFDSAEFTRGDVTTRFTRRDGRFFAHTQGPDGEMGDFEVAYTFGVYPLQQYLVPLPGGRLQALTIAWDARPEGEGGGRWFDLYPDAQIPVDDPLHWTGPAQRWNLMCAECHSTGLRKGYRLAEQRYETRWAEIDVACEACHGPGASHVAWAEAWGDSAPDEASDRGLAFQLGEAADWRFEPGHPIARRSHPRESHTEIETCGRCHARRATLREEPAAGQPLTDTHMPALLDPGLYYADGQIEGEVYVYGSFLQSRMFAAGVSCSDCHDPHSLALPGDPDAVCDRCHRREVFGSAEHHHHAAGSPGASCVECHMPARVYMGVDARRDHSLRVPRPDLSGPIGAPDACTACHVDRSSGWAEQAARDWLGEDRRVGEHYGQTLHAGRLGLGGVDGALPALALEPGRPSIVRATALRLLGATPGVAAFDAIEAAARDADPLVRAAAAGAAEPLPPPRRLRAVKPLLRDPVRAVRIEAARVLASVPPRLWGPGERAALADALAEYRAAQRVNADRPEAHVNLGLLHARFGEWAEARSAYETALRLGPWFVPGYVNLADLDRIEGRDAAGERTLRRGLEIVPESADLQHALGLLLVRTGRREEALEALARAAALGPDQARYAYVYGVALNSAGRSDEAVAVLASAQQAHPGDRSLLLALATIERDRAELDAARGWARKLRALAPDDAGARALVEALEGRPAADADR
jgi:tetratricopeptide (TPR) repeat protein